MWRSFKLGPDISNFTQTLPQGISQNTQLLAQKRFQLVKHFYFSDVRYTLCMCVQLYVLTFGTPCICMYLCILRIATPCMYIYIYIFYNSIRISFNICLSLIHRNMKKRQFFIKDIAKHFTSQEIWACWSFFFFM